MFENLFLFIKLLQISLQKDEILFKKISLICIFLVAFSVSFAENGDNSNAFNKYMSPEGGVNPLSGTVALSKSLASISAGDVSVSFGLSYSGNVFKEVQTRNDQTMVGLVGLGWSLGRAKVVSDNRGTSFIGDDQYYLVLASGGRFKIFKENPSNPNDKWWVEGNPFLKVEQVIDSIKVTVAGDYITYVKGWKITDTKGVVHEYGDINENGTQILKKPERNSTEYDLFWPLKDDGSLGYGLVGKAIGGHPWLYPTVWNVSRESDVEGNYLQYFYEQITESLSGNFRYNRHWDSDSMQYTKESYLTMVVSSKNDSLQFVYKNKGEGEFFGEYVDYEGRFNELMGDSVTDMSIEKVNRKYLSKILVSGKNGRIGSVELCYSPLIQYTLDGNKKEGFVKRLLSAVRFFNKKGDESDYEYYQYYDGSEKAVSDGKNVAYPLGALFSVKGKECGWVEYTYAKESLGHGHMETLDAKKIFGKGHLDDGTSYLVGKREKTDVVVFHRINGCWKEVALINVNDVSDVEFGDQGWFLVKDDLGDHKVRALVYQWNGKEWKNVYEEVVDNKMEILSLKGKAMNVFAGPDYVIRVITDKPGFFSNPKTVIEVVWSKWGNTFYVDNDIENAMANENGVRIMALRNHILVQVNTTDISNAVKFFVYTFDSKGFVKETFSEFNQDNGSMYFLGDDYFVGVEEPTLYLGGSSRFNAWVWNGFKWSHEYRDVFDDDGLFMYTAMDLQAHGQDYYTVRHHSKRYLTNYYWNGEVWSNRAGAKQYRFQVQDNPWFSDAWKWAGFSGRDFFVVGQSRLKCKWWGCDVKKYVYLHLYYMKNSQNKKWTYEYLGSKGQKMNQKEVITGKDWFIEKNRVNIAWIWNGEKWIEESLTSVLNLYDAYSLGEDAFAVSSGNKTNIYYKVGNSFSGSYDSYYVKTKTIYEPVVDKTIEYTYSFTKDSTKIAYDEANNTPLFKEVSVILPSGQGTQKNSLCNGEFVDDDGVMEYNVGLGSSCVTTQEGRSNSRGENKTAILAQKVTSYERYRDKNWPISIYQDRIKKEVSFNGLTKETITYKYSKKNGLNVSTKKKNGTKTTEEITKYVADLKSPLSDYDNKLGNDNRIDVVAGGYSCIGTCDSGRVISAFANGWDTVNNIFRSVSTWKMTPQKRMSQTDVENGISHIVKNGSASSYANWKRSSYNSAYLGGDVIETEEGPKKVKMASFKNPLTRRLYGTAAGCGIDEGLMLSGEYCGPINDVAWSGCVLKDSSDGITGYAINGNTGFQYGRFSRKLLELSRNGSLSATITKPVQGKKYMVSAWVQTFDTDSVSVNVALGSKSSSKNVLTNKEWQKIEFEMPAFNSSALALFSLTTNAPSRIHLQDIRVLPYDAASSAMFWDDMWDKVMTTVNDRGVGSYVVYDNMGREIESYSETAEGNVYLASRKTFVDGNCVITASGDDKLESIKVNGKVYSGLPTKKNFALDAIDIGIELGLDTASNPEVRYALVKGSESDWKNKKIQEWTPAACGGLCPISFKLSEHPEWMLFVDVAPFDTVHKPYGDYAFQFGVKNKDWVVYGQISGFADGENPQFMNPYDSSGIVYQNGVNDSIYRANFSQSLWRNTSAIVDVRSVAYSFAYGVKNGKGKYALSFIPVVSDASDSTVSLAYPMVYDCDDEISFHYRDLKDTSFSVDDMKVAISGNTSALLYRADVRSKVVPVTLRDSTDSTRTYQQTMPRLVADDMLYSKIWNMQSKQWENLGSVPVFDKDTLSVTISGSDTVLKVVHGNIVSYLDGVVCDYNNKTFDMISGPSGKLYVAYIGNPKNFEVNAKITEDDGTENNMKIAPAYIVVKRLYEASETSMGRSVWAGPSKISGQPRYEGDIVSWDGSNLHAIEEAQLVKLGYDGQSLFMAVVYKTHPDERFDDDVDAGGDNTVKNADIDYGELALTVFKATEQQNVNADGVFYSSYLRWTPVKDYSIAVAKKGNSLSDEQNRILYMKPGDIFDLEVRGNTPYIMFGNKANGNRISVIKHDGNRWLSIGNPAFAYPVQSESSVDLAVKSNGNPYVVFKQGLDAHYATRKDKLVTMRYNANDKIDLSISALNLGVDSLNESCAFRQYILNYSLKVGSESTLSVRPTLRTPSDVARIDIYVNNVFVMTRSASSTAASVINLATELNRIELRVVGKDSSELSYNLNTYRKTKDNPDFWVTGNSLVVNGLMTDSNVIKIDMTSLVPNTLDSTKKTFKPDTTKINVHVTGGWEIHVVDSLMHKDTVLYGGDTIRVVDGSLPYVFVVSPDSDTVVVDFYVRPDTKSLFKSSSSVNLGSSSSTGWNYSYSIDDGDDFVYQSALSSSSWVDGESSSSGLNGSSSSSNMPGSSSSSTYLNYSSSGGNPEYSSSSSVSDPASSSSSGIGGSSSSQMLSDVVPVDVRAIADAKFHTSGNIRIGNLVTVTGSLFAGTGVEIGVETSANSEIVSGGNIMLANRANVGELRLTGNLYAQDGAVYGTVTHMSNVNNPAMPTFSFATGSSDIIIERRRNLSVSPGTYRNFAAREQSKVHFAAGDYYFDSFWIDPYVELEFEQGSRIWIANGFNIANFCRVTHSGSMGDLFIYIGSSNYISIGNNVQMKAALYAPRASVQIFDHSVFEGFVWAANFNVEPSSILK